MGHFLQIHRRIHAVNILLVQLFPQLLDTFAEPLEVNDLPFPQEFDDIVDIRIVAESQNVVVSDPGFLFGSQILSQICHRITLDLHGRSGIGETCGSGREDPDGVIHKVLLQRRAFDILFLQISCQLMNDRTDHFQMPQFLCTNCRFKSGLCRHIMQGKGRIE